MLGEGPVNSINDSIGSAEQKLSINFIKANKKFWYSLYYSHDNRHLFLNGKEIY